MSKILAHLINGMYKILAYVYTGMSKTLPHLNYRHVYNTATSKIGMFKIRARLNNVMSKY